jgi:hypothetical protein
LPQAPSSRVHTVDHDDADAVQIEIACHVSALLVVVPTPDLVDVRAERPLVQREEELGVVRDGGTQRDVFHG